MRYLPWMVLVVGCHRPNAINLAGFDLGDESSIVADGADLATRPGADLAGDVLMQAGADLAGADFAGADLATLPGADLATLPGADLAMAAGGGVPVGEACAATGGGSNCVAGASCVAHHDIANGGVCRHNCVSDGDCPKTAVGNPKNVSHCLQSEDNPAVKTCTLPCNPVTQAGASGCATGLFCDRRVVGSLELTTCSDDPGSGFISCDVNGECDPGFTCSHYIIIGDFCEGLCRVGHDEDCNASYPFCGPQGSTAMFAVCQKT